METTTRLPIDDACSPRSGSLGEPRHETLLEMAVHGFPLKVYLGPDLSEMGHQLRAAVKLGSAIHNRRLEEGPSFRLDGITEARRYRLYLAWVEGVLDDCTGIVIAEQRVGIRDRFGNVTEAWR